MSRDHNISEVNGQALRTLPIRPEPASGESFASYVDRLAFSYGIRILTLLARTGVIDKDHISHRPRGYGLFMSSDRLRAFAFATRLPVSRVEEMLLCSYDGVALDLQEFDLADPKVMRRASYKQWAYFSGSHVCPLCIRESGGVWKLTWKLPWSFVCVEHRVQLIDTCPSCKRRVAAGILNESCVPVFPSLVPEPGACRNVLPPVPGSRRSTVPAPCGHQLGEIDTQVLGEEYSSVVDAQGRIDTALSGEIPNVAGQEVAPLGYFSDLRSLCAMILSYASPDDLGIPPPAATDKFAAYVEWREKLRRARSNHVGEGGYWWGGPSHKSYTATPRSTALMTAVVPVASAMLNTESTALLAKAMTPFLNRISERASGVRRQMKVYGLSERLKAAFELAWRSRTSTVDRLGLGRAVDKKSARPTYKIEPKHVPQLLWEKDYADLFADLFASGTEEYRARAFCSMALLRLVDSYTWAQAASELGIPEDDGTAAANTVIQRLNQEGVSDEFGVRLRELAQRKSRGRRLTNYQLLRRCFEDLADIDPESWALLCKRAGVHRGRPGGRSVMASVWVWCYLTGGSHIWAPVIMRSGERVSSMYKAYGKFRREVLPEFGDLLAAHAEHLLSEKIIYS